MLILEKTKENRKSIYIIDMLRHEIKNPIALISANIDYMKASNEIDDRKVELIKKQLNIINEITNQLANVNNLLEDNERLVDLTNLIEDIYQTFKSSYNNINFKYKKEKNIVVKINKNMIKMAINNLIKNSVEALDGEGNINIILEENEKKIKITIMDDGIGLEGKTKNNILEKKTSNKNFGTGIGIRIVEDIIKAKGGVFSLEDRKNKKGCKATIEFTM